VSTNVIYLLEFSHAVIAPRRFVSTRATTGLLDTSHLLGVTWGVLDSIYTPSIFLGEFSTVSFRLLYNTLSLVREGGSIDSVEDP
jgi:hypothetical protein